MINKKVKVGGMTCVACALGIERIIKKNVEVKSIKVNFTSETLDISYEDKFNFKKIEEDLKSLGFYIIKEDNTDIQKKEGVYLKIKLIVSIIFTLPLLYIAMAHMINFIKMPYPMIIDPMINKMNFAIIQLILCIPVLISGYKFYTVGYRLLLKRVPNMDSLIAIGTTSSFLYSVFSVYKMFTGNMEYNHNLYFETTAVIITLVQIGKFLETLSKIKAGSAIKALLELSPKKGRVLIDGKEIDVNISDIKIGDILIVKSGEKIPVDGIITEGSASIDESMITGESIPVDRKENDEVIGATINRNGYIKVLVTKDTNDNVLSQIIKLIEETQNSKAPVAKLADKVSGYFTFVVIFIAIISSLIWFLLGENISFSIDIFISVLVIACPCALGIATPVAIVVGSGKASSLGILFKNAESIETLSKVDTVVFDKTGTLTKGTPYLTDIISINKSEEELLSIVYSIESMSEHPISKAIVNYASEKKIKKIEVEDFVNIEGKGVSGKINLKQIYIGNERLMRELNIDVLKYEDKVSKLTSQGKTIMYISSTNDILGIITVADVIKENSIKLVSELKKLNINTYMITGDNENTAIEIGNKVGIKNILANTLPKDKSFEIKKIMDNKHIVVMVGDGINDSPALMQSNVGIAIGNGTDIAIESADVVLMKNDILNVATVINLSKKTMQIIKQNLFFAFVYNAVGIIIATGILHIFGGPLLNPMIAALAMAFSSVSVITNALRINNFKSKIN